MTFGRCRNPTSAVPVELVEVDSSAEPGVETRIAMNVVRGLEAAAEYRFAVLADQQDEWFPGRLASQPRLSP